MKQSANIDLIGPAILAAQTKLEAVKKSASNPFFKSKYADLNAIIEAVQETLNKEGIALLQPHDGNTVETVLMHKSGQFLSSSTPIVVAKQNDPQALGSAISYARRYGLQSFVCLPSEDDDGERAMGRKEPAPAAIKSTPKTKGDF
jgi:ERF superfamily